MGVKRLLVVHDGLALEAGERLVAVLKTVVLARQKNAENFFRSKSIKYSLHKLSHWENSEKLIILTITKSKSPMQIKVLY